MSTLSWNCQGMGNARSIRTLIQLARTSKLTFIFLMETKASRGKMQGIGKQIGYSEMFVVDCRGLSGDLLLCGKRRGRPNY